MASPSKEENILKLILENSPLKQWHFEEIAKQAKVTKLVANKWLKKYVSNGLLKHIKQKGKFPHYTVGPNNYEYYSTKRIYALEQLHKTGLIQELMNSSAKTVIIFGSTIKGDWYKDSDIDVFVYGDIDFDKNTYERKLNKKIEIHEFQTKQEINEVKTGLIKNVINGYVLKGQVQDIMET